MITRGITKIGGQPVDVARLTAKNMEVALLSYGALTQSWRVGARNIVLGSAVFHGTHTADGGPLAPTGKAVAADYVYEMQFEDGKIRHMTKIWNDAQSLKALGWA